MPCSVSVVSALSSLASWSRMDRPASDILSWRALRTDSSLVIVALSWSIGLAMMANAPRIVERARRTAPTVSASISLLLGLGPLVDALVRVDGRRRAENPLQDA